MKTRYFSTGLALLALALGLTAFFWGELPERVPVHWNAAGEIDRYGSRWELVLFGPGMMLGSLILFALLPWLSPRRFKVEDSGATYLRFMLIVVAMFAYFHVVLLWAGLGKQFDMLAAVFGGLGLFLALLGNLLGKVRRNFYIGIRTPWTLADEANWYATHRLAGKTMVAGGVLVLVFALLGLPWWLNVIAMLAASLIPVGYSLWYCKRQECMHAETNASNARRQG